MLPGRLYRPNALDPLPSGKEERTLTSFAAPAAFLAAFVFVLPGLSVLSPQAVVPWTLVSTAAMAWAAWSRCGWRPRPDRPLAVLLAALLLWAALASLWSFAVVEALLLVLRLAVLAVAGLVLWDLALRLDEGERMRVRRWLAVGYAAGLAILAVELAFDQPLHRLGLLDWQGQLPASELNRGSTTLALLLWPVTACLWRRWGARALVVPVLLLALLAWTESLAAVLAWSAGALLAGLALLHRKAGPMVLAVVLAISVAAAPLAVKALSRAGVEEWTALPDSARERVHVWDFAAERIFERPLLGWGFDSSRRMPDFGAEPYLPQREHVIPLHPHNAALQIWLELGAPGLVIALAIAALALWRSGAPTPYDRAAAQGAYAGALTVALLSFGIWQNQWLCALISLATVVAVARTGPSRARAERDGRLEAPARTG